ncbi:sulfate transporter family protein, partial [Vibrio sp. HENC-03]
FLTGALFNARTRSASRAWP